MKKKEFLKRKWNSPIVNYVPFFKKMCLKEIYIVDLEPVRNIQWSYLMLQITSIRLQRLLIQQVLFIKVKLKNE